MAQFDFLTEYVLELLKQNGLGDLSEEQKNVYVPQILAQAEQRIGLEMLPKLSDAQMDQFAKLVENAETPGEDWKKFWYSAIPNFEEELKMILVKFAEEVKLILAQTKTPA